MAQAFYERCGVGLLDMDYPVNKNFFGDLVTNSPAIIFKVGIIINLSRNYGHTCFKIPSIWKWTIKVEVVGGKVKTMRLETDDPN